MRLWQVFIPGIGVVIVRASDRRQAENAARTAGSNLGATPDAEVDVRGTIESNQIQENVGGFLVNSAGGVISPISGAANLTREGGVIERFLAGEFDTQQNQIETQTGSVGASPEPAGIGGQGAGATGSITTQQTGGQGTPQPTGFNPPPGIGGSAFAPFVFNEALRNVGLDPSRPGFGFLGSLQPQARATEAINAIIGGNTPGTTGSSFANFAQNVVGGGPANFGNQARDVLSSLAGVGAQQTLPSDIAAALGISEGQVGNPIGQIFNQPDSLQSNAARAVQGLAGAALLSRLSPSAFSLFGDQLVQQATENFGNLTASGSAPSNFSGFLREQLRL